LRHVAALLAALAGYISMSQEIVWFRALSYATGGAPSAFAALLGAFLVGIALGSLYSVRLLGDPAAPSAARPAPGTLVSALFLLAGALGFLALPLTANAYISLQGAGIYYAYVWVAVASFPSGALFPLLCHVAIQPGGPVGASLSKLYLWNIVGSTLGPLLTTFVLLDVFSTSQIATIISVLAVMAATLAALALPSARRAKSAVLAVAALGAALIASTHAPLYGGILEKLHYKAQLDEGSRYRRVIETRSGIVAVAAQAGAPNLLFGGGMFDGAFNVDPRSKQNGIHRAYLISALHRAPGRVLEIGLASGSWTRVLADHARVKDLTVVEINPGYLELLRDYPDVATILDDPKVHVRIDDGRRWLLRHPEERFDLIVMNASFHWRSHSTNILSEEFLRLAKAHLQPGGVFYLNTTNSLNVRCTVAGVFEHVVSVSTFVAGSDAPFDQNPEERARSLMEFGAGGRPVFADPELARVKTELLDYPLVEEGNALRAQTHCWSITDDNMATEYKENWRGMYPSRSWAKLFERLRARPP
jgi:spermidine synthase